MTLLDVLRIYNSKVPAADAQLVRHKDGRWPLEKVVQSGHFEEYQREQGRHIFKKKILVSFIGEEGTRARFFGVFEVRGEPKEVKHRWSKGFPFPEMNVGGLYYDLERLPAFDDMRDPLLIDWGMLLSLRTLSGPSNDGPQPPDVVCPVADRFPRGLGGGGYPVPRPAWPGGPR